MSLEVVIICLMFQFIWLKQTAVQLWFINQIWTDDIKQGISALFNFLESYAVSFLQT